MIIIGLIAGLLSAASWAAGTMIFERIGHQVPFVGMTFIKGVLSIMLMGLLLLGYGGLQTIDLRAFGYLSLSGIIGIAIGDSLFFKSLQDLGARVQVIFFLLGQIVTCLLSMLILGEVLTLTQYLGAMILLMGVVIVIWGRQDQHPNKLRGIVYGLLSILCFSVSAIMVKIGIREIEVVTATFYRMVFGTVFTLGFGLAAKQLPSWIAPLKRDGKLAALFVLNTVIITYGGFLLSMASFKYLSVTLASLLGTLEPVFVIIFSYLFLHETIKRKDMIGSLIAIGGLLLILYHQL